MTVFGVDPGLGRVGWGVVRIEGSELRCLGHGLIETPPGPLPSRLHTIHAAVVELLDRHKPDELALERQVFASNRTTAMDVAKATGCVLLAGAQHGLEPVEYAPPTVKRAVTGRGDATKRQVGFMIQRLLGLAVPPSPDDVADALAVALAHGLGAPVRGRG